MEATQINSLGTESRHSAAIGIDVCNSSDVLSLLHEGQLAAVRSISPAMEQVALAAGQMADCINSGGNLIYVGAGSSGLMAMADGLELPGTFGIPMSRIRILFAGGPACLQDMKGGPEDDTGLAHADVQKANLKPGDCGILVSASGSTPYTLAVRDFMSSRGVSTIGLANNAPSPLLNLCDIPIFLNTPPEIISGSTRMGAGTAQKVILNMMSTLMGIHLGHIHDGMMVNLTVDNEKLQGRSQRMVATIAGCTEQTAALALNSANGSVKIAVLLASGVKDVELAQQLLASNRGKLRASLDGLAVSQSSD